MNRRIWLIIICLFAILPSFGQSLPNYVPTSGLMGWWPLDGNANDISGNGYNGTVYGVTSVSDRNGNSNSAYSFDITSTGWGSAKDRIVVTDDAVANAWYQANAFTISTWIKLDVKTGSFANRPHTILGIWDGNGTAVIRHQISPSNLQSTTLSSTTAGSTTISNNDWVHVVTSWDGDTLRHYHNGTAAGKSYLSYSIPSSTNYADITFGELHMGNGHWYHFVGSMDDMGVWDRALSPSEVEQLYSAIVPCTKTAIAQSDTTICFGDPITLSLDVFDQANYTYLGSSNTSKYYMDNSNVGWTNSRNAALAAGADLVVIEDSNEQNLIYSLISSSTIANQGIDGYHIGFYQDLQSSSYSEPSGGWTWVNGNSTYTNWANNEPSNSGCGTEEWGLMYPNGQWNDQCDLTHPNDDYRGIIEVPIFPSVANLSWSTGSTQSFITVSPTQASTYWIETIENGNVCRDSIHIDINHPQIIVTNPASCGNQSDSSLLSLDGFTGQILTPIDSVEGAISTNWSKQISTIPGQDYILEISGLFTYGTYCPSLVTDPAYGLAGFYGRTSPQPRGISPDVSGLYVLGDTLTRPSPDIYNSTSHTYYYPFTASGNSITVGWYDSGSGDNCGSASFKLSKVNQSTLWSTGQTEDEIWVKPNVSTNYWVAQTLGNTTCTTNASVNVLPKEIVGGDTTVCEGAELTLSGSGGFSLNGSNNYIVLEQPGPSGQSQRSFSVWFKTAATEDMSIFGYGSSSCRSNAQLRLNHNANYSAAYIGTWCPYTKGLAAVHGCHNGNFDAIVSDNQWHHVAYVMGENNNYAFNNINLYLDGILVSNSSQGCFHNWGGWQYDTGSDIPITIGKLFNGNGRYFNGELDDFAIFDTAITSTQIQDIYSNGIDLNDSHLTNYFNFENIVGDSIFDLKGDNHGKIYGALNPSASAAPNSNMSYLWSTGDTTSSITFTAQNSSSYWLKTTLNGASCFDTINVTILPSKIIASDSLYCSPEDSALLYLNSTGSVSSPINPLSSSLANGLIAWYPFDGNTKDKSGGNYDLINSGASLTLDRFGTNNSAYYFDGVDDFMDVPIDQSPAFSVSIWIKPLNNVNKPGQLIFQHKNTCVRGGGVLFGLNPSNKLRNNIMNCGSCSVSACSNYSVTTTIDAPEDDWIHFVFSRTASDSLKVYKNGVLVSSDYETNLSVDYGVTPFRLGKWEDGSTIIFTQAVKDDIGFWNRTLTDSEINSLYAGTNILWSTNQNNDSIFIPLDSTLQYYVVASQNGTTCSDSITIEVNQGIQASDTTICYGESVALSTISGQSALWSTGDTATTITVNPATTTKYWATTSYIGGTCSDTIEVIVINPNISASNLSICDVSDSTLLFTSEIIHIPIVDIPQQLTYSSTKSFDQNWQIDIPVDANSWYLLEVSGLYTYNGCSNHKDAAFYTDVSCVNVNNHYTPYTPSCAGGFASWWIEDSCNQRPINDTYDASHTYTYKVRAIDGSLTLKFFDDNHSDNSGQLVFKLYTIQTPTIWSTGQTNDSIWVNPIQTTTYWVNQTLNGKSCPDSVTIVVNQGIQASDTTICYGENVTLSTVSGQSAIWSTGDTATTITVNPATTTKYWATTSYLGGTCSDTLTVFVNAPSIHGQTHSCNSNDSLLLWTTNTSTSTPNSVLPQCNSLNGSLNNGLVAYYPFCGNADDLSSNGNNGVVNGASLAPDRFGKPNSAYIFDGNNDFIQIANSTSLSQSNTDGLTLSCWIKHDQVWQNPKWLYVISKTDGTIQNGDGGYILRAGADGGAPFGYVPVFKTVNGGNQFSSTNPITDVWEHLCLIYNNDTARFYRDGVLVNQYLSGSSSLKPNTRDLILGASVSNSNYFKGVLDEVGIWDRALTQDEVIQLMNTGTGEVSTLWSTSQTTDSIWIKPTQTTTYWLEQSLNGVTCSDSAIVFINKVNIEPSLPTICGSGDSILLYAPGVEQQSHFSSNQTMNWSNGANNDSIWLTPTQDSDYWLTSSINGEGCSDTVSLRILEPTITASTTTSCSPGDSIMLYYNGFNGASGDESILWSTGETSDTIWVTPTTNSTYSVTASRGGVNCLDSVQIDVTTLSNFDPLIPTRIHCEATNTVLDGTDGNATSYSWSTGAQSSSTTINSSGQYWVQAADNLGCSFSDTTHVWLSNIQSNLSSVEPTCYGLSNGSISPNPTGGVLNYSYLWNNGDTTAALSATASGLHWVTITDSVGCSVQDSILLDQPSDLAVTAAAISDYNGFNIPCFGGLNGQALATVSGGILPYTYSWSNGSPDSIIYSLAAGTHTVNIMDSNGCITSDTVLITQPTGMNTSLSITSSYNGYDISCFGIQDGSIQLTASGGVTPYQHYWSNGANGTNISNIGAGLYTVNTVDPNGCSSVDSITLIQPSVLTSTATVVSNYNGFSVSCSGSSDGSAQINALGGNAPYVYSWSNGSTTSQNNGIGAGSYSVIVTDTNGCTVQNSVVLNEPTELQISTSITSNFNGYSISCTGANDGSAMVSASGGTAPYTILWSNGDTSSTSNNLSAGTYFVTITDANGCSKSDSVVLTDPIGLSNLTLSVSSYNGYNISCNGGNDGNISMTGVNGGTAPLSYSWNTGDSTSSINGITAGNYTLTVTDINGCSISDSLTLNQPTVLTSNAWATSNFNGANISCNGAMDGSAQVSGAGGVAPYTFLWNTSDTSSTLSNLGAGTYNVVVTDANGCTTIDTVTLNEPSVFTLSAGIQSNYNGYHISCAGGANGQVAALATGGTGPYTYNWSNGSNSNAQNNLAAGTYIINVSDANGCSAADTLTLIEPPVLSSIASVSSNYNGFNISCQGAQDGIANANTLGGVTPYTINWSNGSSGANANNLGAGTYTIAIQDANGCTTNASVNLTEPAGVTVTATSSPASCFGATDGSAAIAVAGGTGMYNIQWSNGATGLNLAGLPSNWYSYTITTSPNCFLIDSIWVDQPTPVVIQVDTIPPTCISAFDGEINVVAFGGTPGYQYFLNGSPFSGFADELGTDSLEIVAIDMNNCDTTVILAMPAQTQSCLFIPNWFTPNGNSQEDTWRIEGFEYENLRLKVFNVMGQLIYTTESSIYIPWDGSYNGSPLPEGDYYYLIESTVNDSRYSGYVTLLR